MDEPQPPGSSASILIRGTGAASRRLTDRTTAIGRIRPAWRLLGVFLAVLLLGTAVLDEDGTLKQHPALRIGLFVLAMTWFAVMQHLATKRLEQLEARDREGNRDRDEVGIAS